MFDSDDYICYTSIQISDDDYEREDIDHKLDTLLENIQKIKDEYPNEELVFWYDRDAIYYAGDTFDSYLVIGVKK